MGIRYYAYAFDADLTQQALDDPFSILSDDPLADAWGMEPHVSIGLATFEQRSPKRDMLYLDKAWRALQYLTHPSRRAGSAGAAYRMFEGEPRMHDMGWDAWVRTILPQELPAIRDELCTVDDADVSAWARGGLHWHPADEECDYVREFLARAQQFVVALAATGRGMVYTIG